MKAKIREIRDKYEEGDITIYGMETPRSGRDVHSPSGIVAGVAQRSVIPDAQLVWDRDLDERVEVLYGSHKTTRLMVKNVVVEFDET